MKFQAVVFDIYKTLIDIDSDEESLGPYAFLARWLSYCGIDLDAPDLRLRYLEICRLEMSRRSDTFADFDIGRVFSTILSDSRLPELDRQSKAREMALLFRMLTTKSISVYPGIHDLLNRLRGKVKLGIVSNAQRLFTIPELCMFDLARYFDAIILSSDVGIRKPDPELFRRLFAAIPVPPEEALYIGDNIFDDVYGASNVGMKTVWINRGGMVPETSTAKPDFEIKGGSCAELAALLEPLWKGY